MKKILSLLCAVAIVFSASAAPQLSKKELDEKAVTELLNTKKLSVKHAKKSFEQFRTQKFEGAKLLNKAVARAPKAKKDVTFDIAVSDITASAATIAVTPSDASASYYWTYVETSEASGKSDAELVALLTGDMDYMIMLYNYFYGMEVTYADLLIQGADTSSVSNLSPETSYTVVAAQLDDEGNLVGAVASESFTTLELILPEGGNFVAVSATEKFYSTDNDVWVKMADADGNQFNFDIVVADGLQALESGVTYTLSDMIENYSYASVSGAKIPYASASLTKTVQANGDYSIAASFVDTLGNTWNISYQYTKPVQTRQESLTFTNLELDLYDGAWQISGFNADETQYVSLAAYTDQISGNYTEAELAADYSYIYTGLAFDAEGNLESGNKFALISANLNVAYNEADSTIIITGTFLGQNGDDVPEFTLSLSGKVPAPEVSDMTFEFASGDEGITVTPSNNDDAWDWIIVTADVFANYGADQIAESIYGEYGNQYAAAGEALLAWDEEISWYTNDEKTGDLIPGDYVLVVWGAGAREITTPAAYFEFSVWPEAIDNTAVEIKATKAIRNGQLLIIKNGVEYNAQGTILK
ncbi:MAG: hypothetical protein IJ602_05010 [Paludibacteraceae bacterium]|nr:hypothetical protein [Paludibacteraceae bacterium]